MPRKSSIQTATVPGSPTTKAGKSRNWSGLVLAFFTGGALVACIGWFVWPAHSVAMFKKDNGPSGSLPITTSKALTRLKKEGQLAPWGRIDYTPIAIAPPKDLLVIDKEIEPTHWIFPEHSRLQAERQLALLGLSASELAKLAASPWKTTKQGVHVTPPEDLILDLVPAVRRKLYAYLAQFRQNTHANPLAFRRERLEDRLQRSGLNVLSIKSLGNRCMGKPTMFSSPTIVPWSP